VVDAGAVSTVAFSADGQLLASGHADGSVVLWDVDRGVQSRTLEGHTAPVSSVDFGPDNATVASASHDKSVILWDVTTGQQRESLVGHTGVVTSVAFSSEGEVLASGSRDPGSQERNVILWEATTGEALVQAPVLHTGWVNAVALSPDGATLASAGQNGVIILWHADVASLEKIACGRAGRNLRPSEWDQYFPGQSYRLTCVDRPRAADRTATPS
jgi:WD40 repeat protein